jgi:hypothetical protein
MKRSAWLWLAISLCMALASGVRAASLSGGQELLLDAVDLAIEDLGDAQDKATKKIRKTLQKSRVPLLKESERLSTDAKNLATAAKALAKSLEPESDLALAIEDSIVVLEGELLEGASTTFDMFQTMDAGTAKEQARLKQQKMDDVLFSAEDQPDSYRYLKALGKAAVLQEKFRAWMEKLGVLIPEPPAIPMAAKVNDVDFLSGLTTGLYEPGPGRLRIKGLDARALPFRSIVIDIPSGVTGAGTYSLNGGEGRFELGVPPQVSSSNSGTLTVIQLDVEGNIVRGTFSFEATGAAGARSVTVGTFDVRDLQ